MRNCPLSVCIEQERRFLKALDFDTTAEDVIPLQYRSTCEWILGNPEFHEWKNKEEKRTCSLWIFGKPGSGKSVLAKFILGHLRESTVESLQEPTQAPTCLALGYFMDARSPQKANTLAMVRSLLHQLLSRDDTLFRHVYGKPVFWDQMKTLVSLRDILLNVLQDRAQDRTFIVLDAFDECDPDTEADLMMLIQDLKSIQGVKLLCTSRHFQRLHEVADCSIELRSHVDPDLKIFIESEISNQKLPSTLRDEVSQILHERSQGSFLWARLALETLQSLKTAQDIRDSIDRLPATLYDCFMMALGRIHPTNSHYVLQALYFSMTAKTHLTSSALIDLLAAAWASSKSPTPSKEQIQEAAILDEDGFVAELRPFLRMEQGQLVLMHQAVVELLESHFMFPLLSDAHLDVSKLLPRDRIRIVHGYMAQACLARIFASLETSDISVNVDGYAQPQGSLDYASIYWMEHMREARGSIPESAPQLLSEISSRFGDKFQVIIDRLKNIQHPYSLLPECTCSIYFVLCTFDLCGTLRQWFPISSSHLEMKDSRNRTPLHLAAASNAKDSVDYIIEVCQDKPAFLSELLLNKDLDGAFPIAEAARFGHGELCCRLLETVTKDKMTLDTQICLKEAAIRSGNRDIFLILWRFGYIAKETPTQLKEALELAVDFHAVEVCQDLLEDRPQLAQVALTLHHAIKQQRIEIVELLVTHGSNVDAFVDHETALHVAVQQPNTAIMQYLLEKGADIFATDAEGKIPLHLGVRSGRISTVELLLKSVSCANETDNMQRSASVNLVDKLHRSAVHYAAMIGHDHILRMLAEHGANILGYDRDGMTPLHLAASHGREAAVTYLLALGADANAKDKKGKGPLSYATGSGNLNIVSSLIDAGADVGSSDKELVTPLQSAARCGADLIVRALLEMGADANVKDASGKTPLHYACESPRASLATLRELISFGSDPNVYDSEQHSPLHYAIRTRRLDAVHVLLRGGAFIDKEDAQGKTPLHYAVTAGFKSAVDLLTAYGADVTSRDSDNHLREDFIQEREDLEV